MYRDQRNQGEKQMLFFSLNNITNISKAWIVDRFFPRFYGSYDKWFL